MLSIYSGMSYNLNHQTALDCSSTKDHPLYNPLPLLPNEHCPLQHTGRNNYMQQSQPQPQMNNQSIGMPIIDNSFYYPLYSTFTPPPPPPPPPPPAPASSSASVNHARFYPSPTPSFHQTHHFHQHQPATQHGINMTVSPLLNSSHSPCQMYDNFLPNDYYMMQPGRRSSVNTSRSSSPQQQDTLHSRSASPVNKRYSCRICNKRFTRPSSLTTHIYSHTGEKPFKCPVAGCGRNFSVVSNLRRHAKIHGSNNHILSTSSSSSTAYSSYSP
ncbi:killer toxin resistant protein [Mucor velutinosus]|uniref:Killer toxin resistant protein n=1 Tax=Mucor velutinosus TaxID=708070 RepID=A0AAN7D7A5_9FUNG|nr:killer toxin resistant protein [Mucor velutinosus]